MGKKSPSSGREVKGHVAMCGFLWKIPLSYVRTKILILLTPSASAPLVPNHEYAQHASYPRADADVIYGSFLSSPPPPHVGKRAHLLSGS